MNRLFYFSEYFSLNESSFLGKSDIGVIGPMADGILRLQIPKKGAGMTYSIEGDNISMSYGDNKVTVPKKCCEVSNENDFDVIDVNTDMNWFKEPENEEALGVFIESYIDDKFSNMGKKINPLEEDVNLICDVIGINSNCKSSSEITDGVYECELDNGMEVEFSKKDTLDPFSAIRIYSNNENIHPSVTLKRKGKDLFAKYRTKKGIYEKKHDSFKDLLTSPTDSYLLKVSLGEDAEKEQRFLVEYLLKLFKYHNWAIEEDSSDVIKDKHTLENEELNEIMEMLKNTIEESHIEEMYIDARRKFASK